MARTLLRARDGVHHRAWRILTMAGGSPDGEMKAIREVMPKSHVTAVDNNSACLDAAIDAGADDVLLCDLEAFTVETRPLSYDTSKVGYTRRKPAQSIDALPKFDVVNLDLCGGVNESAQSIFRVYRKHAVSPSGVMMFTFSYGRDVTELFSEHFRRAPAMDVEALRSAGIPDGLSMRIVYLFGRGMAHNTCNGLRSVIAYKGGQMPMCALLVQCHRKEILPISYTQVEPGDFELAVCYPDSANLYDCPSERIETLRRRFAALKAAATKARRSTVTVQDETRRLLPAPSPAPLPSNIQLDAEIVDMDRAADLAQSSSDIENDLFMERLPYVDVSR